MKWLRNILKGLSLTTALFVFQACYGTPPVHADVPLEDDPVETVVEETVTEAEGTLETAAAPAE